MKFRKYHPAYIELSDEEEAEYQKWHDVNNLVDCLKILFPNGPYSIYNQDEQEESVINTEKGNKLFIETRDNGYMFPLMDYCPDGSYWVLGFVKLVHGAIDDMTAEWNEDKEEWELSNGLPEKRY